MCNLIGRFSLTSMEDIVVLSLPLLDVGKAVKFTVVGNSMYPLFRSNREKVTVVKAEKIKKRDIILYRREDGSFILHRVVGKGKLGYKLCGDDQVAIEYPVKEEDVFAVMTSFERNGREYSAKCLWYRMYSFVWCLFIKQRPFMFKVLRKLKKLFTRE